MGPGSLPLLWTVVGLGVASAVALAFTWDRPAGRRARWLLRSGTVLACLVTMLAVVGVLVNRETAAYPTWGALVGGGNPTPAPSPSVTPDATEASVPGAQLVAPPAAAVEPAQSPAGDRRGRMISYQVTGTASGLSMETLAFLPAVYDDPAYAKTRFPVIQTLHGFPGSPVVWRDNLEVQSYLDREIGAGRMAPTVVVFPRQTPDPKLDTECTDMAPGPKTETYLTVDVVNDARRRFRIRADRDGWGLLGYSAGGFCAINLALKHPDIYSAGAAMSAYSTAGIRVGDGSEDTENNPVWRLKNRPVPPVALYLTGARDDKMVTDSMHEIMAAAKPPLSVTTGLVDVGGHTRPVWRALSAPCFNWLSARLARPVTDPTLP